MRSLSTKIIFISLVLLLILATGVGAFLYFTRPTPNKTLDAFCSALTKNDYQTSYQQLSQGLQQAFTREQFTTSLSGDRTTGCSYTKLSETGAQAQADIKFTHISTKSNLDVVLLIPDEHGIWKIDSLHAPYNATTPSQASIHHLTVSSRQWLKDPAAFLATDSRGGDTGIFVASGERVIILLTSKPTASPVCATGVRLTLGSCPAISYSFGLNDQAKTIGERSDFYARSSGTLFLGMNMPVQSSLSDDFKLTLVILPKGTATGLWSLEDGFVAQSNNFTISMQAFTYDLNISHIDFYLLQGPNGSTTLCTQDYHGQEQVSCKWDLTIGDDHAPITNGPIVLGFTLTNDTKYIVNPDGVRSGNARYIKRLRSLNYAGYGAEGIQKATTFHTVTASWQVPKISCSPGETSDASIWAGMTGVVNQSQLAQTGVSSTCYQGRPFYYAWYEMFPKPPETIDHDVIPGDEMTATVSYSDNQFELTLEDEQGDWHFSTRQRGTDKDTLTALCILEPAFDTQQNRILRLSNFDKTSISCNADNQPIGSAGPQNVRYEIAGPEQHAKVSELNSAGDGFTVQWLPE